jgi:galactokinase
MTGSGTAGRVEALKQCHAEKMGDVAARMFQAPGRVNLLGEHTDYSGGFCMPAALNFNTLVAATPRSHGLLRLHSMDFKDTVKIRLSELEEWRTGKGEGHWSAYPAGVAWSLRERGVKLMGADLTMQGNVPPGAGLSSSASVEVATATTLLALAGVLLKRAEVALACQRAENVYVGAPCGIMDQFISASGVAGNALAIDTRALTAELAPIPDALRLVVCNSMVRHSVGGGEYGERRSQVEEAATAIGRVHPRVKQLRDATLAELEEAKGTMSHEAYLRGRHVISDSQRVLDGLAALRADDVARFGRLMDEAHVSFRDDFGASCEECDLLVELAQALPGCLGSRLTGGGFGGCTVSLVEAEAADDFAARLKAGYKQRTGVTADIFVCEVADGAGEVQ